MYDFTKKLHQELLEKLESAEIDIDSMTIFSDPRPGWVGSAIATLKEKLKGWLFSSEQEEIDFFKYQLPLFLSACIYYTERFRVDPVHFAYGTLFRTRLLERQRRKIDDFLTDNAEFYDYLKSGLSHLDKYYFLQSGFIRPAETELLHPVMSNAFGTPYCLRAATILAYMRLVDDAVLRNEDKNDRASSANAKETRLVWTDPKAGLIELIYSLKEQGSFNHGKADLKIITRYFERAFCVGLGNVSRTFQEIVCRKTGYTLYLDSLKTSLISRIDEIEARHVR